jgi:hypothetical protein
MYSTNVNDTNAFIGIAPSIITLSDLVQMECSVRATRAVRIDRGDRSGRIYFARGQVVHAELGELHGEMALFEMLRWTGGTVVVADGVHPPVETIDRHWQSLLLEARRPDRGPREIAPLRPRSSGIRRRH